MMYSHLHTKSSAGYSILTFSEHVADILSAKNEFAHEVSCLANVFD